MGQLAASTAPNRAPCARRWPRHGRSAGRPWLGHQKPCRDLSGGQSGDCSQRECDGRGGAEAGVAAQHEHLERVVVIPRALAPQPAPRRSPRAPSGCCVWRSPCARRSSGGRRPGSTIRAVSAARPPGATARSRRATPPGLRPRTPPGRSAAQQRRGTARLAAPHVPDLGRHRSQDSPPGRIVGRSSIASPGHETQRRSPLANFWIDVESQERAEEIAAAFSCPGDTVELRPTMRPGGES